MRNLVIIYGSPRSGTTELFNSLLVHPSCKGGKDTNETPGIDYEGSFKETSIIDELWEKYNSKLLIGTEKTNYLVLKAPGYCFAWDYFSKLENYNCKYIFTMRDPYEVIESMLKHSSKKIMDIDLPSTSCPKYLYKKWEGIWNKLDKETDEIKYINRAFIRFLYHMDGISDDMRKVSLELDYKIRSNSREVEKVIRDYLTISYSTNLLKKLSGFRASTFVNEKRREEINNLIFDELQEGVKKWQ